jgi:hypothetical protein
MTTEHVHVDFVGHARVTARLLDLDPEWDWEPLAINPATNLPMLDENGGLWITLTIGGKTRTGYGHADGKTGGDAIKEAISDAIKTTAMRFGVALEQWMTDATLPEFDDADLVEPPVELEPQTEEEQRTELRGQITAVGKAHGWNATQAAAEFSRWSGGQQLDLRTAGVAPLSEFLDHLRRKPQVAA